MTATHPPLRPREVRFLLELEQYAQACLTTERPSTVYEECCEAIAFAKMLWQIDHPTPLRREVTPCALP
jgi:hypothetical protein